MALHVLCPNCETLYRFAPEQIGASYQCQNCGAEFVCPGEVLQAKIEEISGSFRRIFWWSLVLAAIVSLLIAGILSGARGEPPISPAVAFFLFLVLYTGYFMSIGFGFKAIAQESCCLFFLISAFGNIGAFIGAFFLGPIVAPFQILFMWNERRRCRARWSQLSRG